MLYHLVLFIFRCYNILKIVFICVTCEVMNVQSNNVSNIYNTNYIDIDLKIIVLMQINYRAEVTAYVSHYSWNLKPAALHLGTDRLSQRKTFLLGKEKWIRCFTSSPAQQGQKKTWVICLDHWQPSVIHFPSNLSLVSIHLETHLSYHNFIFLTSKANIDLADKM